MTSLLLFSFSIIALYPSQTNSILLSFESGLLLTRDLMTLKQTVLENIVTKGENVGNHNFLLLSQYFLTLSKTEIIILPTFNNMSSIWQGQKFYHLVELICYLKIALTLYHTIPTFIDPLEERSLLKTLWWPAFSPFPTMFSTLSKTEIIILVTFVICKCVEFGQVQKFVVR